MTRVLLGSQLGSSAGAVQFFTTESPKLTHITFKPRSGNTEVTYLGHSSAVDSTVGFALSSGADSLYNYDRAVPITATVKATTYWMSGNSAQRVDWVARFED